ncbi:hypothetical protein LTR64_001977 [Lithohypha guttulata]|uniref:uncharacterized protein n=1 Tax=Lithohypha guttulata TaxID=1690604 RepID=UPI002DE06609|nr:hypothetical protein LTR51_007836 [Lithohypha guttulata]
MAARIGEVAGYVHEVVRAFDKAGDLVRRIGDRRGGQDDSEVVQDLYKSLALGSTIVQGYFDADSRRLGAAYTAGDLEAQIQLRDVLLGLKTLMNDLSDVLLDDKEIDFRQMQDASDDCRVNAGVCLGQLSQRLAAPTQSHLQQSPRFLSSTTSTGSPSLQYSSSQSRHSSTVGAIPRTPDPYHQQRTPAAQLYLKRPDSQDNYYIQHHRQRSSRGSSSQHGSYSDWSSESQLAIERDVDKLSLRRPSSHTLAPEDGALLSSTLSVCDQPGQQDLTRDSYTPFGAQSSARQTENNLRHGRARYDPDDYSPQPIDQHDPFYMSRESITSFANRAYDVSGSTYEQRNADFDRSAQPEPLRLPDRPARQFSNGPQSPPPRRPIPSVPQGQSSGYATLKQPSETPVGQPPRAGGQEVPIPPRSDPRPSPSAAVLQQRPETLPRPAPPFQPSHTIQRAMERNARRQHAIDQSPSQDSQTSSRYQNSRSPSYSRPTTDTNSNASQSLSHIAAHRQPSIQQITTPPQVELSSQFLSQISRTYQQTSSKLPSVSSVPIPQHLPLTLPDEKNTSPYCKGAFRLFLGLSKKTFIQAQRPVGMASFAPYWRCEKCLFEGPMATATGAPDKKGRPGKPEKVFDPTIRECGPISTAVVGPDGQGEGASGIRFKWAFLAKCHVPQKSSPDNMGRPDGSFGSYGCLFCTAEGTARGWNPGMGMNDAASTLSGKSARSASMSNVGSTPVFGNLQLLMDHLQMHRRKENWPCPEMRGRMKCVVGRVADRGEDWEVNFLPL